MKNLIAVEALNGTQAARDFAYVTDKFVVKLLFILAPLVTFMMLAIPHCDLKVVFQFTGTSAAVDEDNYHLGIATLKHDIENAQNLDLTFPITDNFTAAHCNWWCCWYNYLGT